ncbi:DHH family phosphoesterase [Staphylococcus aureus]
MAKTYIFGHKNPDTDAISSAIIMAELKHLEVIQEPKHTV